MTVKAAQIAPIAPPRLTEVDAPAVAPDVVSAGATDQFKLGSQQPAVAEKKKPAQSALGKIEDEAGVLKMGYVLGGANVRVSVGEQGVVLQVDDLKAREPSPIELMMISELAGRALDDLGKDQRPEAAIQRARLESTILLVGQAARARFAAGLPTDRKSRDVARSDLASATLLLTNPKNIDEAFDKLCASSTGTALVRRFADDNVMAWNMKWDLVTKPTKSFDFSYFSIEQDPYGYAYMGALLALRLRDIPVRGITDFASNANGHGFSMAGKGADYMQELAQYGAQISLYNKIGTRIDQLKKDGLQFGVLASDHDKLCVVDAGTEQAEGETGGRNVAGAYHQDALDNAKSWRDDSAQYRGKEVVQGLVDALERELASPAVTLVKPDGRNMNQRATELLVCYQMMEVWMKGAPMSEPEKGLVRANAGYKEALGERLFTEALARVRSMDVPDEIRAKPLTYGETKKLKALAAELANDVELKGSRARYDALDGYEKAEVKILDQTGAASAAPGQRFNEIAPGLLQLINGAQKHIVIQNPYVVMTEPMMKAFEEAAARGVKIDIVTNSPESTDSAITQGFFLNDWKSFLDRVPSARLMVATGQRKFHAKAFVIDGKISADTSFNADLLSALVNGEIVAVQRSVPLAKDLLKAIQGDLDNPANGFREWTIQRDKHGKCVRDEKGEIVEARGPKDDVKPELLQRYKPMQFLTSILPKMKLLSSLRHGEEGRR